MDQRIGRLNAHPVEWFLTQLNTHHLNSLDLIYINQVVVEIIFQDEWYQVVLNVLVSNGRFGCGAFVFSCGFVLSKGPNET